VTVPWLTVFGGTLAALAAITSFGMILMPAHWQKLEAWAYGGARRPWTVWALAGFLVVLWAMGLADFVQRSAMDRGWAGWALVAGVPALWALKAAALVFNPAGRAAVSGISDPRRWRQIGVARLPIALGLAVLTGFD